MFRNAQTIEKLVDEIIDNMDLDDVLNYVKDDLTAKYELDEYKFYKDWEFYGLNIRSPYGESL